MKLKISVHKKCQNKQNPEKVAKGWSNIYEQLEWLMSWVQHGYGWCATHFVDKHRKSDNTCGSNLVVIDIDGDVTLEKFWATNTAKQWCAATYTSSSHTEDQHRFRALFPLEIELETINQHRGAYWLVVNNLLAELEIESLTDNCGQKPERLWYGNTNAEIKYNEGVFIPEFLLKDIDYEDRAVDFVASDVSELDIKRCKWLLQNFLRPSEDGEYESYYVPVMAACAGIGKEMFDVWVEWVLKGHHGEKEENIRPFKWKGLGQYAGHTTIYSLAKRQTANWTHSLPEDLRFGAVGAALGYTETDPVVDLDELIDSNVNHNLGVAVPQEPVPDSNQAKKRGRPRRSNVDQVNERKDDVKTIQSIFSNIRRNRLTGDYECTKDGTTHRFSGNEIDTLTVKLSCENDSFIPEARIKQAFQYAAGLNVYCPIQNYLDRCSKVTPHEQWDSLGEAFLGSQHKISTMTLQRMMIGAVARAFNPGCSMSWLPILVGAQGAGKSMFARNLVPEDLFAEISIDIELLMKEAYRLHVAWLLELPEIDGYFKGKTIEKFKNLVTTRVDEVRRPYESLPSRLPRAFVMIGTTNRNQFLVDSTGNRRFVPLEISTGFQIPWQRLSSERDALWSAALQAYRNNQPYEFNTSEIAQISEYIQEFADPDPWMDKISAYVSVRSEVKTSDILTQALDLDHQRQSNRESRRVTECLQALGWRRLSTSRKDPITGKSKSVRLWQRPIDDPLSEDHILSDF
jgi:hypothetical protein